MSYFDAFTANLFHEGADGRPMICHGRTLYLVTPEHESRIRRFVKIYYALMLTSIVATQNTVGLKWNVLAVGPAFIIGYYVLMAWLVRPLERANPATLKPSKAGERFDKASRAMGRPTLWVLTVMSGLMTLGGVFVAYQSEMKLVFPGLFFAFCTATFVVKLWRTRLSRAPIE